MTRLEIESPLSERPLPSVPRQNSEDVPPDSKINWAALVREHADPSCDLLKINFVILASQVPSQNLSTSWKSRLW